MSIIEKLLFMLEKELQVKNMDETYELIECARTGNVEGLKNISVSKKDDWEVNEAIYIASGKGFAECVRVLIPMSAPSLDKSSALRWAASKGNAECVKLLLPVCNSKDGIFSALYSAAVNRWTECVELLAGISKTDSVIKLLRSEGDEEAATMVEGFLHKKNLLSKNSVYSSESPRLPL